MKPFHLLSAALLSLAAIPTAYAAAAADDNLLIIIDVSISSGVIIAWVDDTGDNRTWTAGGLSLAGNANTLAIAGAGNVFTVKNNSQVPVKLDIRVNAEGTWIHKIRTGSYNAADEFSVVASIVEPKPADRAAMLGGAVVNLKTWTDGSATDDTSLFAGPLAAGANRLVNFDIVVPASLSLASHANPGTISMMITGSGY